MYMPGFCAGNSRLKKQVLFGDAQKLAPVQHVTLYRQNNIPQTAAVKQSPLE